MGTPDRFSSMSVPERLSVDGEETRGRKESDKSNASENVSCGERGAFLTGAYFSE